RTTTYRAECVCNCWVGSDRVERQRKPIDLGDGHADFGRRSPSTATQRWVSLPLNPYRRQKNANVRISMLSRGRACGGEVASSKDGWAVQRAPPSLREANPLNPIASSRRWRGNQNQRWPGS